MHFLQTKSIHFFSILLLFFALPAYTQVNIIGRVVDETTNAPLPDVSVYFNRTTLGTYTNQQGDFYFNEIQPPISEMVILCNGYKLLVYKPAMNEVQGKRILFKLQKQEPVPGNKIVVTEATRQALLAIFRESFLGITEEAAGSTISNENNIYFGQGNSKMSFTAYADTPLIIINNLLGYKISYKLVEFFYDDSSGQSYFLGYARYEEMPENKKWLKARKSCYYGSTLHFYRSLIGHQMYEQGFGAFILQPVKDTVVKGFRAGSGGIPTVNRLEPVAITEPEILYIDSTNNFSIRLTGRLLVQYNKDPASKKFLMANGNVEGNLDKGVESYLVFTTSPIGLNTAGVLNEPAGVTNSGYWMYEKFANLLPYNYQPGK